MDNSQGRYIRINEITSGRSHSERTEMATVIANKNQSFLTCWVYLGNVGGK